MSHIHSQQSLFLIGALALLPLAGSASAQVNAVAVPRPTRLPPITAVLGSSAQCVGTQQQYAVVNAADNICGVIASQETKVAGHCAGNFKSCTFGGQPTKQLTLGGNQVVVTNTGLDGKVTSCTSFVNVVDKTKPIAVCPPTVEIDCAGATTSLANIAFTCQDPCGCKTSGQPAGCTPATAGPGVTRVTCTARDSPGNLGTCQTQVTVRDRSAPTLSITATPAELWPPNKAMIPIHLQKTVRDNCDAAPRVSCTATASDGAPPADMVISGESISLRADRAGQGARIYTITCTATDSGGNRTNATATVTVPHDRR